MAVATENGQLAGMESAAPRRRAGSPSFLPGLNLHRIGRREDHAILGGSVAKPNRTIGHGTKPSSAGLGADQITAHGAAGTSQQAVDQRYCREHVIGGYRGVPGPLGSHNRGHHQGAGGQDSMAMVTGWEIQREVSLQDASLKLHSVPQAFDDLEDMGAIEGEDLSVVSITQATLDQ